MSLKDFTKGLLGGCRKGALGRGQKAPEFCLSSLDGEKLSLADALKKGPVLAAFFKISCPTCQFALPFLQRIYEMYGGGNFTFWAVSQNDAEDTRCFLDKFGVKFPTLLDEKGYPASNQYGLTNVPSVFLIAPDGTIQMSSIGFSKADMETIAAEAARATGKPVASIFRSGEAVPEFKPG